MEPPALDQWQRVDWRLIDSGPLFLACFLICCTLIRVMYLAATNITVRIHFYSSLNELLNCQIFAICTISTIGKSICIHFLNRCNLLKISRLLSDRYQVVVLTMYKLFTIMSYLQFRVSTCARSLAITIIIIIITILLFALFLGSVVHVEKFAQEFAYPVQLGWIQIALIVSLVNLLVVVIQI